MIKISFTGDIMSSSEQDESILKCKTSYDEVFSKATSIFTESSYLVVNLETTIAGEKLGYTETAASFNTPEGIIPALKKMGVNFVTNANNHILDRGIEGLHKTIDTLDRYGIRHTGCYKTKEESEEIQIVKLGGVKFAILSYTYGTNSEFNGNLLQPDELYKVDLLKDQLPYGKGEFQIKRNFGLIAERYLTPRQMRCFRVFEKIYNHFNSYTGGSCIDTVNEKEIGKNKAYIQKLKQKILKARQKADFVILCLHTGGQYNTEVGLFTKDLFRHIKTMDIDLVVGNHPHCVLGSFHQGKRFYTYSLGNFSFTPGGMWYVDSVYAEYSVVLHAYIDEISKSIVRYTYSIMKNVIGDDGISRVFPVYELLTNNNMTDFRQLQYDIMQVSKRFSGKIQKTIEKEYLLKKF